MNNIPGFDGAGMAGSGFSTPADSGPGEDVFARIEVPRGSAPPGDRIAYNEDDLLRAEKFNALHDDAPTRPRVVAESGMALGVTALVLMAFAVPLLRTGVTLSGVPAAVIGVSIAALAVIGFVAAWLRAKSSITGWVFVTVTVFIALMSGFLFVLSLAS